MSACSEAKTLRSPILPTISGYHFFFILEIAQEKCPQVATMGLDAWGGVIDLSPLFFLFFLASIDPAEKLPADELAGVRGFGAFSRLPYFLLHHGGPYVLAYPQRLRYMARYRRQLQRRHRRHHLSGRADDHVGPRAVAVCRLGAICLLVSAHVQKNEKRIRCYKKSF